MPVSTLTVEMTFCALSSLISPLSPRIVASPIATVTLSAPVPAITWDVPSALVISSSPPTPASIVVIDTGCSRPVEKTLPLSPRIVAVPVPIVILSRPAPPTTNALPLPLVITSSPPMPVSTLTVEMTFWIASRMIEPLSPRIVASPFAVVTVSAPMPAITKDVPSPLVILSSPPRPVSALVMERMMPAPSVTTEPKSPSNTLLPAPVVTVSPPAPARTIASPSVLVIVSAAPMPVSFVTTETICCVTFAVIVPRSPMIVALPVPSVI